jgi:hypothetical protein
MKRGGAASKGAPTSESLFTDGRVAPSLGYEGEIVDRDIHRV